MAINLLDHCHIATSQLAATVAFYRDVLGLTLGDRPPSTLAGEWICADGDPVIHVTEPVSPSPGPTGAIHHIGFVATGFEAMDRRLQDLGIPHDIVDLRPEKPLRQIYVVDPNHVTIELNFPTPAEDSSTS